MEDDRILLERWREGDADAGNALFERHFDRVRRFFRNKVAAPEVEDLVQRTFIGCVEGRDRLRDDVSFRGYLFAVARNQLYRFLREQFSGHKRQDPDMSVSSVASLGCTPSTALAKKREQEVVLQALQQVSVEQQTMLELYYWDELTGPEIAEILQISPVTVRTRLHRARAELQRHLRRMSLPKAPEALEAAVRGVGKL